jgi:predicted TIM-barrel fold metal-dependent hydrolase
VRNVSDAQAPVVPGHYRPVDRPLTNIEQLAEHHGVAHLVLLQSSVYDYDNTVMLEALRQGTGRHRGVAVLESGTTDAQWHRCIPAACEACDSTLYRRLAMTGTSTRTFMHSPPRIQPWDGMCSGTRGRSIGPGSQTWGSDWPHTSFAPDALPDYASVWEPVARVIDAAQQVQIMLISPEALYR